MEPSNHYHYRNESGDLKSESGDLKSGSGGQSSIWEVILLSGLEDSMLCSLVLMPTNFWQ